jgi:outer membrane protein OmpA-like peptidoglycan-associated protein
VKNPSVETAYFAPGSATLSHSTKKVLTAALNRLLKANIRVLNVIGYSDQTPGSKSDPIALYRANAVAGFLLKLSPKLRIRVSTAGQASDKGIAMTTAAQRINRRVEIRQP